ncbi:MAG: 30S ribosomal protein S3 [Pseudomonadota bacterium]
MGQKVHPTGFRLGILYKEHDSDWFTTKHFAEFLHADIAIRKYLKEKLHNAGVSKIKIKRPAAKLAQITIQTARPGIVIGKKGEDIERLKADLSKRMGVPVVLTIQEIRRPEMVSQLVAESIAQQLESRVMFRRAMKKAITTTMRLGAQGVKVMISGRLGGAEIARTEWAREGRVPLHTLRADIDYGFAEARTTYGVIGIKVWIFKGEVFERNAPRNEDVVVSNDSKE